MTVSLFSPRPDRSCTRGVSRFVTWPGLGTFFLRRPLVFSSVNVPYYFRTLLHRELQGSWSRNWVISEDTLSRSSWTGNFLFLDLFISLSIHLFTRGTDFAFIYMTRRNCSTGASEHVFRVMFIGNLTNVSVRDSLILLTVNNDAFGFPRKQSFT